LRFLEAEPDDFRLDATQLQTDGTLYTSSEASSTVAYLDGSFACPTLKGFEKLLSPKN